MVSISLLDEDNAVRVLVNGFEKFLEKAWLAGDGRAANTILSKHIFGTPEGLLRGTNTLTIPEELFPVFDLVIDWLSIGDEHITYILSDENASQLYELALYFGLDGLLHAIEEEKRQRDEEETRREQRERDERARVNLIRRMEQDAIEQHRRYMQFQQEQMQFQQEQMQFQQEQLEIEQQLEIEHRRLMEQVRQEQWFMRDERTERTRQMQEQRNRTRRENEQDEERHA